MPPMGCLCNQTLRFDSFSLGILLFALDVYMTRRNLEGWKGEVGVSGCLSHDNSF